MALPTPAGEKERRRNSKNEDRLTDTIGNYGGGVNSDLFFILLWVDIEVGMVLKGVLRPFNPPSRVEKKNRSMKTQRKKQELYEDSTK